jgi:membrane protease YdiL (CAAX protease family)
MLIAGLSVAVGGGIVALVLYFVARRRRQRLIPATFYPVAKWDGVAVAFAFVMFVLSAHFVQLLLIAAGFFRWIYGPDFPVDLGADPTPAHLAAGTVRHLWAAVFTFPLQLALISSVAQARGGPNPLAPGFFAPNVVSGYLTWLLVTPAAFSVFALANIAHSHLTNRPPDRHPLTVLGDSAGNLEWTLFVMQTVIIAPLLEELVFRGLLLPWLCQRRAADPESPFVVIPKHRSPLVLGLAVAVALLFHVDNVQKAIGERDRSAIIAHLIPGAFFISLIPLYVLLPRWRRLRRHLRIRSVRHSQGILASSALFAAFHASVWPSPVPLMLLAMGIGYLSVRTQSLIGPVVVHSMFNAVSAALLLMGVPA